MLHSKPSKAFTLIELLIVVAIIAILAAIAVPNFLEAQVRAKVSTVYSDFRTLRTGLEAYAVDRNRYPDDDGDRDFGVWSQLTTPVAYITGVFYAPWRMVNAPHNENNQYLEVYDYGGPNYTFIGKEAGILYFIVCAGPDRDRDFGWGWGGATSTIDVDTSTADGVDVTYNSTNGTTSDGDIMCSNLGNYW